MAKVRLTKAGKRVALRLAKREKADVLLINADLYRPLDTYLIRMLDRRRKNENLIFILTTAGGDPDAAYRIARAFQRCYEHVVALVPGYCKSAGTLCVIGAHELAMSSNGELGPLDIQLRKQDELGELSSGLVLVETINGLRREVFKSFEEYMLAIKRGSRGGITFKTCAEIASRMAIGAYESVYRQINPENVGEVARSMRIAQDYASRLRIKTRNISEDNLQILVGGFPSHGFVIDRREAKNLFREVRRPSRLESELLAALGLTASELIEDGKEQVCEFITEEKDHGTAQSSQGAARQGTRAGNRGTRKQRNAGNTGVASGSNAAATGEKRASVTPIRKG